MTIQNMILKKHGFDIPRPITVGDLVKLGPFPFDRTVGRLRQIQKVAQGVELSLEEFDQRIRCFPHLTTLIDVRMREAYDQSRFSGSAHISDIEVVSLFSRLPMSAHNPVMITLCEGGAKSFSAAMALREAGAVNAYCVRGGVRFP